jgi:hypothetical protein
MLVRKIAVELSGCAVLAAALATGACTALTGSSVASNATVTTYVPLTSVEVDANALFARLGCGSGPGVPYKYVVSVYAAYSNGQLQGASDDGGGAKPLTIGVSDCFTDAVFQNLSNPTNYYGFTVDVYDEPTYETLRGTLDLDNPGVQAALGSNPTTDDAALLHGSANWSTTCFALQQPNVQSLAACNPLP